MFTANQAGSGPAIVQNVNSPDDQPSNTIFNPAHPGQTVILWGTGAGPAQGDESGGSLAGDLANTNLTVYVGGQQATIRYRGRSGCCAGIDQIVFDVPTGVSGCYVPIAVAGSGLLSTPENRTIPPEHAISNFGTMAVAPAGSACTDATGLTAAELSAARGTKRGDITVQRATPGLLEATEDRLSAQFGNFDPVSLLRSSGIFGLPSPGSCLNLPMPLTQTQASDPVRPSALDAGAALNIAGPRGMRSLDRAADGFYAGHIGGARPDGATDPAFLDPGDYTLDNGLGGRDVGAFTASFTMPRALTWTNKSPTLYEHSFSPTFRWSGGDSNGLAVITSVGYNDLTGFYIVCTERVAQGQFTIPRWAYVGNVLHTSSAPNVISLGAARVSRFSAPGMDVGLILALAMNEGVYVP